MSLESVLAAWTSLDEVELGRSWTWRDGQVNVRYALYRTLEEAQEAVVRATVPSPGEARRILALAQRAFGDLRGLLVGVADDLLDRSPRSGEWPLREVLRHVLVTERRYAIQTAYAVERGGADPVRIPDDRLPTPAQVDVTGRLPAILARIGEARADTQRRLASLPAEAMTRPTVWAHYRLDVRFRLHRFAAHVVEHAIQCEKTLADLGWRPTEGRRIVRHIWALVGELEGLGATDELAALERLVEERAASLTGA